MKLGFSFEHIVEVEFYVGIEGGGRTDLASVPVDLDVKEVLKDTLRNTLKALAYDEFDKRPPEALELAEKYGANERLIVSMTEHFMEVLKEYVATQNQPSSSGVLEERADDIAFYFVRFIDSSHRKLFAFRRASTFKAVLRARSRLVQKVRNTLKVVTENIFKLDEDYDFLISGDHCLILHPTGFEVLAQVQAVSSQKASTYVKSVSEKTGFIHDSRLTSYVKDHPRAAKLVTSIHSRKDLDQISEKKFRATCKKNAIQVETIDGKLGPKQGFEIAFLEALDRRRYSISLIDDTPELYLALSRKGVAATATSA